MPDTQKIYLIRFGHKTFTSTLSLGMINLIYGGLVPLCEALYKRRGVYGKPGIKIHLPKFVIIGVFHVKKRTDALPYRFKYPLVNEARNRLAGQVLKSVSFPNRHFEL